MMNQDQVDAWTSTANEFRREVEERLQDVTDVGELESLVRVLSISCDVASAVAQLKLKEIELELERYRIELSADMVEVEVDEDIEQAIKEADKEDLGGEQK